MFRRGTASAMVGRGDSLVPQMAAYRDLSDPAEVPWLPYVMYFHRRDCRSPVVNTDRLGFRLTSWRDSVISPATAHTAAASVRVLAGSSTVFGVGATGDGACISSRLSTPEEESPWLNFGGRGYSATQELLLFLLNRHLLPPVRDIVIMSGANDLILTGLKSSLDSEYGSFFSCGEYYATMEEAKPRHRNGRGTRRSSRHLSARPPVTTAGDEPDRSAEDRVRRTTEQIARNLDNWLPLADASGARLSYVLQPVASWIRDRPPWEEQLLFDDSNRRNAFEQRLFEAVEHQSAGKMLSDAIAEECGKRDIRLIDMNEKMKSSIGPDQWVFIDRVHLNDDGYRTVSQIMTDAM